MKRKLSLILLVMMVGLVFVAKPNHSCTDDCYAHDGRAHDERSNHGGTDNGCPNDRSAIRWCVI